MNLPSYQKEIIKWLTGVAGMVGVLFCTGHYLFPEVDNARVPASVPQQRPAPADKDEVLNGASQESQGPEGKGGGALRIEISASESVPYVPGQLVGKPIQLSAVVQAMHPMQGLQFVWHLPRGVMVTSGEVSGELGDLAAGETRTLELVITTSTEDNRQIHLNVFRKEGNETVGDVAQYNTVKDLKDTHNDGFLKAESTTTQPGARLIQ